MIVESGFSMQKKMETVYQSKFAAETYDAIRVIKAHYTPFDLNTIEFPDELLECVGHAREEYGKSTKEKKTANDRKRSYAADLREELHIYKRPTIPAARAELQQVSTEIAEAEKTLKLLKQQKSCLEDTLYNRPASDFVDSL